MLTELLGKGGQVCQYAKAGEIKCPLIVRPTSEDIVTGELFQTLGAVNPRWWFPQLLNTALGTNRFRQQIYRRLRIELWRSRSPYPKNLLPWDEGRTEVDATITWENPATTVFVEAKFGSGLAKKTAADDGTHGYPSDQLIRNIRVGLLECGWFRKGGLFQSQPRDFAMIVLAPETGHSLVAKYKDHDTVLNSIPHAEQLIGLPVGPFVGEIGYNGVVSILASQRRWVTRAERILIDGVIDYLEYKRRQFSGPDTPAKRQQELALA